MKNRLLLLVAMLLSITISSYAQSKFGDVTKDELTMTVYEPDTTASAVMLLKDGNTRFIYSDLYGFQFEYTLKVKVKILKPAGLDNYSNFSVFFKEISSRSKEVINGLSGTTYNLENDKIVKTKLSKEFITEENIDERLRLKKFTMPAAKVGSVIEYKYTIVSDLFYDLRTFNFQENIPVQYAKLEVKLPEYFLYNVDMQGYEVIESKKKTENESFPIQYRDNNGQLRSDVVRCIADQYTFVGKNISALKNEPYLWTLNDYVSKVAFELQSVRMPYSTVTNYTTTWDQIDEDLKKESRFGGNLKKTGLFKDNVSKGETSLARASEIQNMIKSNVKWDDQNRFYPSDLKDALKKGIGNSADINFLLINALNAGGFESFPVVLSTRSNGRLPFTHPSSSALNYVITGLKIDTTYYFADASAKYGDWNILPEQVMVPQARLIRESRSEWYDLSTVSSGRTAIMAQFTFKNNQLEKKVTENRKGIAAYNYRTSYFGAKDQNEFVEKLATNLSASVTNFLVTNMDNPAKDTRTEYVVKSDMSLDDDILYIQPLFVKQFSENPFKSETRKFPVNFNYLNNYTQIVNITIPEGYKVEELPKTEKLIFGENDIVFAYRIAESNGNIQLQYQLNLNKILFLADDYAVLQDFYAKIVLKNSEQIVLKKKEQ